MRTQQNNTLSPLWRDSKYLKTNEFQDRNSVKYQEEMIFKRVN